MLQSVKRGSHKKAFMNAEHDDHRENKACGKSLGEN